MSVSTGTQQEAPMHLSIDFERDDEGWWPGRCECGWDGGMYPEAEDAADALMQHAREMGYLEAKKDGAA